MGRAEEHDDENEPKAPASRLRSEELEFAADAMQEGIQVLSP